MKPAQLTLRGVHFAYPGGAEVLRGVELEVAPGQALGLVGANGAGKSTLLLHFVGIHAPLRGEVLVDGEPLARRNLADVRRRLGVLLQDAADQLFMPTVREDVAFAPRNLGVSPQQCDALVQRLLSELGLSELSERATQELSGGEQRLVALAGVLAQQPDALLFDEPSAGLDPRARRRLLGHLASLSQTRVVASHDLDLIWDLCDRVAVMDHGRIAACGPAHEVLSDAALLDSVGLELPLRLQGAPSSP